MKILNKYRSIILGSSSGREFEIYDCLYFKDKNAYVKLNGWIDTMIIGFSIDYNPIKLVTSYQCYVSSLLDNFTFASYTNSNNYLRVRGSQVANNIRTPFNSRQTYSYNTGSIGLFLGTSENNIFINNNSALSRGAEMKLYSLTLTGYDTEVTDNKFVPALKKTTGEMGLLFRDIRSNGLVFYPAVGNVELLNE